MSKKQLTKSDWDLISTVFASASALDIDVKHSDDGDFSLQQFSDVWDFVNNQGV